MNGGTYVGIEVEDGDSNIITGNNLINNLYGIGFTDTSYNLSCWKQYNRRREFLSSLFTTGIVFGDASNNTIYHNNFITVLHMAEDGNFLVIMIQLTFGMMVILMAETIGATTRQNIPTPLR